MCYIIEREIEALRQEIRELEFKILRLKGVINSYLECNEDLR